MNDDLDMLSDRPCPNAGADNRRVDGTNCQPGALTMWGWCGECWQLGRVPDAWVTLVDEQLTRAAEARGDAA